MKAEDLYRANGIDHDLRFAIADLEEMEKNPQGRISIDFGKYPELHKKVHAMLKAELTAKKKKLEKELDSL